MEFHELIQKKLSNGDTCNCCLFAYIIIEGKKLNRVVALVEGQGEYGLFLYTAGETAEGLTLERTVAIDSHFKFNIVSSGPGNQENGDVVPVRISTGALTFLLELPQGNESATFLGEVKRAIAVQSQNAGFGIPSSFSWIEKYIPSESDRNNPFLEDIFNTRQAADQKQADPAMDRSPSLQGFQDNFVDSWSSQGSQSNGSVNTQSMLSGVDAIKRSYEKSLDELGDLTTGQPLTGRENIIRLLMKQKEEEFTDIHTFRVFCGTWNVNGQAASESISEWLACDEEPPDIYAIGFQELDLSKNAYLPTESVREGEWFQRVHQGLHPKAKYKLVKLIRLVGIMLIVFIKEEHKDRIFDDMATQVPTGIMGLLGNKGGVGVRFEVHDSSVCFVSSHLAAHIEEYERRNQDFREINNKMIFNTRPPPRKISDHDMIFWIGDLNYRLSDIDIEKCKTLIAKGDFNTLIRDHDQLCRQMSQKKVFLDYLEGPVNFMPTYKYDTGTDNWDSSEKCRIPAWCDRILWHGCNIHQVVYRSHPELKLSDHKPVSALFNMGVKKVDNVRYRRVYEDVMKQLDRWENEFLPQVTLDATEVHFVDARFIEPQSRTITIKNTGQVLVQFNFITKPSESTYCKPWLTVKPNTAVINLGESCEIELEVYVNKDTASKLNSGADTMDDILVLHLEGGKDLFISVSGNYIPSSFGASIEALVHMFGPIRDIPQAQLIDLEQTSGATSPTPGRPFDVPKEIWRLVDHIYRHGMQQEELFQMPGLHAETQAIRKCLDTGVPEVIPGTVHSVAEALLVFLQALAEPVIPYAFYNKCLDCCSNFVLCKQVLSQIPPHHKAVFTYFCAFLRKLLQYSDQNSLDIKFLAQLFGSLLLRAPPVTDGDAAGESNRKPMPLVVEEGKKRAAFLYHFLTNEYDE